VKRPVKILLADDHALVRAGIRTMLEGLPGIEVIGEASDGREALKLVASQKPDLVFMDIAMPGLNGLDTAARVARDYPDVRVVILSMYLNEEYVLGALQAGATGYLLKDADPSELELAVRAVTRGEMYLSPGVSKHVIEDYLRRMGTETPVDLEIKPVSPLTSRQREVLQLIAEGHTSREIAQILAISLKTVESHRQNIMERLDLHDLASLVRYAVRTGLVSVD
jgi:DNA-binding NarL/FixJ family response regulator